MRTHVEFRTSEFSALAGEAEQVNPGRWGKQLAAYLAGELAKRGYESTGLVAEDWGWSVRLKNDAFPLWLGCGNYEEYPDGFLVFIEPSKPFLRRLFRKIDARPTVDRLTNALDSILESNPSFHDISWWQGDAPAS